jgi:hypothetical protein
VATPFVAGADAPATKGSHESPFSTSVPFLSEATNSKTLIHFLVIKIKEMNFPLLNTEDM